ncbi:phosphopantetheine adenylyltransferase [[Candida] jaroonii]|uniref:Phosphopantetheine adenylyltransferase n=1 Tax=[Candida] jaroonii TaxID=467808 RepID=A0ACA9Y4H3_9ASCO|nr:phosphopantetheine adenylyltransferase [[Candida] jaroonii]
MTLAIEDPFTKDYSEAVREYLNQKPDELNVVITKSIESADSLNLILNKLYDDYRKECDKMNLGPMYNINIIFNELSLLQGSNVFHVNGEESYGEEIKANINSIKLENIANNDRYKVVAVGGTFDHLHDGHKILLSVATYLSTQKLIVGVTDAELLKNKKYKEQLDSFEKRIQSTLKFLKLLDLKSVEIYKIVDVCGPTGYVENIDCLVLSQESSGGGEFVNNFRKSIGFKQLEVFTIDLIGGENKLSSTDLRKADA